jgi:hypothetical protein
MLKVSPGAKKHLARASFDLLEADDISPEGQRLLEVWRYKGDMAELRDLRHGGYLPAGLAG